MNIIPECLKGIHCPGTDYPIANFSSELEDGLFYVGLHWPDPSNGVNCMGMLEADTQSQADELAAYMASSCINPFPNQGAIINPDPIFNPGYTVTIPKAKNPSQIPPSSNPAPSVPLPNTPPKKTFPKAPDMSATYCVNKDFGQDFFVQGQYPPFTVSISGQPSGYNVTVNDNGATLSASGNCSAIGYHTIKVTVTDKNGNSNTSTSVVGIMGIANCNNIQQGFPNVPYTGFFHADGGKAPYNFTASGAPNWLNINTNGTMSGTPTLADFNQTYPIDLAVTDANQKQCLQTCYLFVGCPNISLHVPDGTQCTAYSQLIPISIPVSVGGWQVVGCPPTGLSVLSVGILSGTPQKQGNNDFVVQTTHAGGITCTLPVTFNVIPKAPPSVTHVGDATWGYSGPPGSMQGSKYGAHGTMSSPNDGVNTQSHNSFSISKCGQPGPDIFFRFFIDWTANGDATSSTISVHNTTESTGPSTTLSGSGGSFYMDVAVTLAGAIIDMTISSTNPVIVITCNVSVVQYYGTIANPPANCP
jgi:hypothetical protein